MIVIFLRLGSSGLSWNHFNILIAYRREHVYIDARNTHVRNKIISHYNNHARGRNVEVYCISNKLHQRWQREVGRRRSSTNEDKRRAVLQTLESSGIPRLREFIQSIPKRAQIEETRRFLNVRLRELVERTDLWLSVNMHTLNINQEVAHAMETGQRRLEEVRIAI